MTHEHCGGLSNGIAVLIVLLKLPTAFHADRSNDGYYDDFFCHHRFMRLDLNALGVTS